PNSTPEWKACTSACAELPARVGSDTVSHPTTNEPCFPPWSGTVGNRAVRPARRRMCGSVTCGSSHARGGGGLGQALAAGAGVRGADHVRRLRGLARALVGHVDPVATGLGHRELVLGERVAATGLLPEVVHLEGVQERVGRRVLGDQVVVTLD